MANGLASKQPAIDTSLYLLNTVKDMSPSERTLGDFEQLVLFSLVRLGNGTYGARIRRDIETRTGRDLSISAVYVTLKRLEKKGYIRMYVGEPQAVRGGRRRKHIELLAAGEEATENAYRSLKQMMDGLEVRFKTV